MNPFALALLSIGLSVTAQFILRMGMAGSEIRSILSEPLAFRSFVAVLFNPFVLLGFFLYGSSAIAWLGVLAKWEVSKAYPMVGLGFVFTLMIGYALGESVTPMRIAGVLLIFSGVLLMAQS